MVPFQGVDLLTALMDSPEAERQAVPSTTFVMTSPNVTFFIFMYICMCALVYVCAPYTCRSPQRSEEGVKSSEI